jgi:hypothetical protein
MKKETSETITLEKVVETADKLAGIVRRLIGLTENIRCGDLSPASAAILYNGILAELAGGTMPENSDDELPDEHPLWCVNSQINGLIEGEGASEDHDNVIRFFLATGLPAGTVARIHRAIVCAENKERPAPLVREEALKAEIQRLRAKAGDCAPIGELGGFEIDHGKEVRL